MDSFKAPAARTKSSQHIQVYVRCRPLNHREKYSRSTGVVEVPNSREIVVKQPHESKSKKYTFDKTFGPDSRQTEVYDSVVGPMIKEVLDGYNCTVFAYGQTGTGKTYTMVGDEAGAPEVTFPEDNISGIIPRALNHMFDELRLSELEFSVRVSYLELYNEELCDLLSTDDSTKIRIYDDSVKKGSVIIQGLEEIPVHCKTDVYKLLAKGQERRKTAATLMNAQSSRSHTVFSILVNIKEIGHDGEELLKIGKLNLVDLAGSENISKAGNEKGGIRARETVNINQSLLTLGRVITALVERAPHVPYRESKLTRLLQESLGGRTKTSIIATISPGNKDLEETLNTLDYAYRAKSIQNKPEINQKLTKSNVLKEMDRLKRELTAAREKCGIYLPQEDFNEMTFKIESQNKELVENQKYIKMLTEQMEQKLQLFNEVSLNLVKKSEDLKNTVTNLELKEVELGQTKTVLKEVTQECNEKKYILDKHVKTEEKLTEQAKQLIDVVEVAATDSLTLQETIERRKEVDKKITVARDDLINQTTKELGTMITDVENFTKLHNNKANDIVISITSFTNESDNFTTSLVDHINKTFEKTNSSSVDILNFIESTKSESELANKKFKINLNEKFSNFVEQQKILHEKLKEKEDELQKQKNQFNINLIELILNNKAQVSMFLNKQANQLQTILNKIDENFDSILLKMNSFVKEQNLCNQNHLNYADKLEKLLEESKINTIKLLEETTRNAIQLVEESKGNVKNHQETTNSINCTITEINELNKNHRSEIESNSTEIFNFNTNSNNQLELKVNEYQTELLNINNNLDLNEKETIKEKMKFLIDEIKIIENTMDTEISSINEILSPKFNDIYNQHLTIKNHFTSNHELIKEKLIGNHKRIKLTENKWNSSCQCLIKTTEEFKNDTVTKIQDCKDHFVEFCSHEIQTYTPSGMTPVKRHYNFPKDLVATSPHDRLKQRYRQQYNNSFSPTASTSTMSEETSFDSDLLNMDIIMNSTQTNGGSSTKMIINNASMENYPNGSNSGEGSSLGLLNVLTNCNSPFNNITNNQNTGDMKTVETKTKNGISENIHLIIENKENV